MENSNNLNSQDVELIWNVLTKDYSQLEESIAKAKNTGTYSEVVFLQHMVDAKGMLISKVELVMQAFAQSKPLPVYVLGIVEQKEVKKKQHRIRI